MHLYLFVKFKVCEGKLDCLSHFLLLDVHTSDVCIHHIWLLVCEKSIRALARKICTMSQLQFPATARVMVKVLKNTKMNRNPLIDSDTCFWRPILMNSFLFWFFYSNFKTIFSTYSKFCFIQIKSRSREPESKPEVSIMMLLSASGGRTSTRALLCLCRATDALGFSSSRSMVLRILT